MQFYKNLYVSDKIANPDKVRRYLKRGMNLGLFGIYVVTLCGVDKARRPRVDEGQMQYFHSFYLRMTYYRRHEPLILGIAKGRADAVDLCARIVQDTVDATGNADVFPYLFPEGNIAEYFEK